jgi:hypothetical protein
MWSFSSCEQYCQGGYKPLFASAQLHLGRPCEGLAWIWLWLCCWIRFVKVLFDQLDLVGNRVAVVKRINFDDFMYQTQAANHAVWIGKKCHGVVEAYFLDGVHAGCSEDVLESEGFAGGDFSNDVDDPNDS